MKLPKMRWIFPIGILGTVAILYLGFYFSRPVIINQPFDSDIWRAAAGDRSSTVRLAMVDDLRANYLLPLPGMKEEGILNLLGPPESKNYFHRYHMMYRLGTGRSWLPGPSYLVLAFDETGHVAKAAVLQD